MKRLAARYRQPAIRAWQAVARRQTELMIAV